MDSKQTLIDVKGESFLTSFFSDLTHTNIKVKVMKTPYHHLKIDLNSNFLYHDDKFYKSNRITLMNNEKMDRFKCYRLAEDYTNII